MKEYLKMADVFVGEVWPEQISGWKHQGRYVELKMIQQAAANAINSHDELVAEVDRLRSENDSLMKCRMAAREFFNSTVASGGVVKVSSYSKDALSDADKASDWLEKELKETASLVK